MTMDSGEQDLIKKTLLGDQGAFEVLMNSNRPAVYRHCLSLVKDQEIAEDLTQETFLHAYEHLNTFRMQARFSTWIWRIAHNLSLNYLKKQRVTEQPLREEQTAQPLFEEEVDEEFMLNIQKAMEKLPIKQRAVFEMYDLQHIPQKQIAQELGVSHGTVRSRLHYARKKIRELLQAASDRNSSA